MSERKIVEPTEDEKKNGWTTDSLSDYLAEQENRIYTDRVPVMTQNSKYSPFRWRK